MTLSNPRETFALLLGVENFDNLKPFPGRRIVAEGYWIDSTYCRNQLRFLRWVCSRALLRLRGRFVGRLERARIATSTNASHSHITLALIRCWWSRSIVPVSRDWWHAALAARSIMYMHSVLACTSAGPWERAAACASHAWLRRYLLYRESSCMVRIHFAARLLSSRPDVAQVGVK